MTDKGAPEICEIRGLSCSHGSAVCPYCGRSFEEQAQIPTASGGDRKSAITGFGYGPAMTGSATFALAEKLFLTMLSGDGASGIDYDRNQVLENGDSFYFPVGWIGCSGHLVSKNPLRLISFGSYIGPEEHIWAYYTGISLAPLGKDRKNKFKILGINDRDNTVRVLKTFLDSNLLARDLIPRLSSLPVEFSDIDLYFGISGLLEAKENDWFRFEVT